MTHWVIIIHDKLSELLVAGRDGAPFRFRYYFTTHVEIIKEQRLASALNISMKHASNCQIIFRIRISYLLQVVEQLTMNSRVSGLTLNFSWPHVEVSCPWTRSH